MSDNVLVRRLGTLAELNDEDRLEIAELCTNTRKVAGKHHISREGDRPDYVHVMLEGWGARYKTARDGGRQIVDFLVPGDFCDLHVTLLREMDHGIIALTPCLIARINERQITALTETNHRIIRAMWWSSLVDQAILREWVLNLGRRDAYTRIAHLMCEMHFRMKRVGLVDDGQLSLPVTQQELADATGLTPVHVNRTLKRLREEKLIEFASGMLTTLDIKALRSAAGFDPSYLHVERRVK
jgi:CRP-like cAMP-binding protein